jgi:hypothetical protein
MASTKTVVAFPVASPATRICCILSPDGPIFTEASPLEHRFGGTDAVGIIYTCNAGFVDLGHLRDLADLTLFYYRQIDRLAGASGKKLDAFDYGSKTVEISKAIPPAEYVGVAQAMAYTESVVHEIETYWRIETRALVPDDVAAGGHNSSFSPEDIVSNFLGTVVGGRAIESMKAGRAPTFDEAVENELGNLLVAVGGKGGTAARTRDAFAKIDGIWFTRPAAGKAFFLLKLNRRNFGTTPDAMGFDPWIVPGVTGCTGTTWPATIPRSVSATAASYFTAVYEIPLYLRIAFRMIGPNVGSTLDRTDFAKCITAIKADAATRYGTKFDKPEP